MSWAFNIGFLNGFIRGFFGSCSCSCEPRLFNFGYQPFYRPFFNFRPDYSFTNYWNINSQPNNYIFNYSQYSNSGLFSYNNSYNYYNPYNTNYNYNYESTSNSVNSTSKVNNSNVEKTQLYTIDGKIDKASMVFLGKKVTSKFGMRMHPVHKVNKLHGGIDLSYKLNEKVYSFTDGTVTRVSYDKNGYGNWIEIEDAKGIRHRYAHANKILAKVGQEIKAGEIIMLAGATGTATGPHVHYETLVNGKKVDPFNCWENQINVSA